MLELLTRTEYIEMLGGMIAIHAGRAVDCSAAQIPGSL
eukprot:SAG11_NODE_18838_length_480_cov_0.800525_1_plen_37_part_10